MWCGRRLTKVQPTSRQDHVWPEVWTNIGKALSQNRQKQEWKNEEPKLDHARRLTGIRFIDPDDQDYKETLFVKKCEEKIGKTHGTSYASQQDGSHKHHESCKAGNCPQKIPKTIYGCTVESHESTRQRVESSVPA